MAARLTSSRVVDAKSRDSAGEIVRSRSLKAFSIVCLPADRVGGRAWSGIADLVIPHTLDKRVIA